MRILYFFIWCAVVAGAALFELDVVPAGFLPEPSAEAGYGLQVLGVALTLAGTYGGVRWAHFPAIARRLEAEATRTAWQGLGLAVIAVPIAFNFVCYYGFLDTRYAYCLLITLIGLVFCLPRK